MEPAQQSQGDGPGARLAAVRERAGIGLTQAATQLHLDASALQALEADRYEALGVPVYVRGHLRRYAQLLGESSEQIEALYAARARPVPAPDLTQVPVQLRRARAPRLRVGFWPASAVVLVLVLASVVWWAVRVAPRGTAPAASGRAAPAVNLSLKFRQAGWAEVYDARGQRLFYQNGVAGAQHHLSGSAPLRVVLDNPAGVAINLNGRPIMLGEHLADVPVRFTLDRTGRVSERR